MSATTQNLTVQLGVASEIDFTDAAASDNNKLMCVIYSEGSVVMVKNSILKGGSADEIEIKEDENIRVKLSIADLEKLAGKNTITYELYMWVLLPEQPYDPKIFIGSVTVNDYAGVSPSTFIFNLGKSINVPSGITDLTDLNASLASFPTGMLQQGDLCSLSNLPNLYKHNGTEFEVVVAGVKEFFFSVTSSLEMTVIKNTLYTVLPSTSLEGDQDELLISGIGEVMTDFHFLQYNSFDGDTLTYFSANGTILLTNVTADINLFRIVKYI